MFIAKYKKIFISLSIILIVISLIFMFTFGLKAGIDFKGGALLEVTYLGGRPEISSIESTVKTLNIGQALIQPTGENGYIIKTRDLSQSEHETLSKALSLDNKYPVVEKGFTSIGPSVGNDLTRKAILSIISVIIAIILFITYAFRKVSQPVPSWKYNYYDYHSSS